MCQERGKTWTGDDPKCAFEDGVFNADNWMCATANGVRDIVSDFNDKFPLTVDFRWCEDQKYATICLDGILDNEGLRKMDVLALWVSWYKSRGRTEAMWLLNEDRSPRPPTEEECLEIIEHHKNIAPTLKTGGFDA